MNIKTTIVLVAVLIVAGVAAFVMHHNSEKDREKPTVAGALFDVKGPDVTRIAVSGERKLVLQKSGADWRIVEPIDAPADSFTAERLASAVAELKAKELEEDVKPADAGLAQPRYVIEFAAGGKNHVLNVGRNTGIGDQVYVSKGGKNDVRLAAADVVDQIQKPLKELRQPRLLDKISSANIRQIEISQGNEKLTVQKEGLDWKVTAPQMFPAESSVVSDLTFALTGLNASEFVEESDIVPALNPNTNPRVTVWFSDAAPTTKPAATQGSGVTVKFGGYSDIEKKNVFVSVSNPPALAIVPVSAMESFQKKPLDLRDRRVMDIDPAQVSRIAVSTRTEATTQPTTRPASHQELVIERKKELAAAATQPTTHPSKQAGTKPPTTQPVVASTQPATQPALPKTVWALRAPAQGDASQAKVEALLNKFHPLRVEKYIPASAATTKPSAKYMIDITTEIGGQTKAHHLDLVDPGENKPLIGSYDGLNFELDRSIGESFADDYTNKPEPAEPAGPAAPGGLPPGFPGFGGGR